MAVDKLVELLPSVQLHTQVRNRPTDHLFNWDVVDPLPVEDEVVDSIGGGSPAGPVADVLVDQSPILCEPLRQVKEGRLLSGSW